MTYLATKGVDEWLESLNLKDLNLNTNVDAQNTMEFYASVLQNLFSFSEKSTNYL